MSLRSSWLRKLLGGLAALLLLVLALPFVIAHTPLRGWILAKATADLPIRVSVGGMSLNWVRPIELNDVTATDLDGGKLAAAKTIRTERSLLGLIWNRHAPGTIHLEGAEVNVVFAKDGSNLETVLHALPKSEKPGAPIQVAIVADGTTLRVRDADANKQWTIDASQLSVSLNETPSRPIAAKVLAKLVEEPAFMQADLAWQEGDAGELVCKLEAWPLAMALPILRRAHHDLTIEGKFEGDMKGNWKKAGDAVHGSFAGELRSRDAKMQGGPLGPDRFALAEFKAPLKMRLEGPKLVIEQMQATCDVGSASVVGTYDFSRDPKSHLQDAGWNVSAQLDLAKLARLAPKTLHLHEDVVLDTGAVAFEARSVKQDASVVWQTSLKTTPLAGRRGAARIAWPEPITLDLRVRDLNRRIPTLESVKCESTFLSIAGKADENEAVIQATVDLEKLAAPLSQFVDLGTMQLAGKAQGWVRVLQKPDQRFEADGAATLDRFRFAWAPGQGINDERLAIDWKGKGLIAKDGSRVVEEGSAQVKSGADVLDIQLREPWQESAKTPTGAIYAKLQGELADWRRRALPFAPALANWQLSGKADGQIWIKANAAGIECQSLVFTAKNFGCMSPLLAIRNEPSFDLQTAAFWRTADSSLELGKSKLSASALEAITSKLVVSAVKKTAEGSVDVAGDLARLQQWLIPLASLEPLAGAATSRIEFRTEGDKVAFDLRSEVKNLSYGPPTPPPYREPLVEVAGKGELDLAKDRLQLSSMQLKAQYFAAETAGEIAQLSGTRDLNLQGKISYDLEKIQPLLQPALGATGKIQGRDSRAFKIVGPLAPKAGKVKDAGIELAALTGEAGFGWTYLSAHGIDVGPTDIKTVLRQGWVQAYPIETTVSGGKLKLQPNLRLEPLPRELVLGKETSLENAKLTPAMFAGVLGHTLPILANATSAEGELSVAIQGARIPLADFKQSEAAGTLTLHHAKIGPGPLVQELAGLIKIPPPYSLIKENQISIRVAKSRVYHENLELMFPDNFNLKTEGSVGMDGTLDLRIDMPIPSKLVGGLRLPDNFAKMRVKIPVTGTVEKPRIDPRAMQDVVAQILRNPLNLIPTGNPGGNSPFPIPKISDFIRPKGD
jgi:translocation and assembly module TamB